MSWINLFKRKPVSDVSDVSEIPSDSPEARNGNGPSDVSDVSSAFLMTRTISQDKADAHYDLDRLLWCLDAYRAEGLKLHFYAVSPEPQFTLVYPEQFTPSERIMVQGYFLKAVDLIAEHAHELTKGRVLHNNWRHTE
ncbi:hypothetical protein [Desulfocurvibacter africanus]|uniref:hypothetical protein n=1 Tax=Desulfocurvibacter africanus TaxID=873 RepID=UPI00041843F8|nr:hypothetical protein [Desulfocurvibacter africanus]